jgi:hypothetical protein
MYRAPQGFVGTVQGGEMEVLGVITGRTTVLVRPRPVVGSSRPECVRMSLISHLAATWGHSSREKKLPVRNRI